MGVDAGGKHQRASGGGAQGVGFGAVGNDVVLDGTQGGVFESFGQAVVDEGFELGGVALGVKPHLCELGPARAEADLVVEAVDVVATHTGAGVGGDPPAAADHVGFVVLVDEGSAVGADVPGGFDFAGDALAPVQAGPLEVLLVAAVRAGDVVAAAVAGVVAGGNAAVAFDGGRGDEHAPAGGRECGGAAGEQVAGVVARCEVGGELVFFVDQQGAHAGGFEARRAAGVLEVKLAAGKILEFSLVGAVAAFGAAEHGAHSGGGLEHGAEFLVDPLVHGHFAWQADHDRAADLAHGVAQRVDLDLCFAKLDRKHHGHVAHRAARAHAVHWLAQRRVTIGAPPPGLGAALGRQHAMAVGPLGDGERLARGDGAGADGCDQAGGVGGHAAMGVQSGKSLLNGVMPSKNAL